jgi:UBX domain-containing protein 1
VATLSDLSAPAPPHGGHGHAHDDDDGDHAEPQNFFAGGERSGLSVQNPDTVPRGSNNIVRDILKKASHNPEPSSAPGSSRSGAFRGAGHTLGSEDIPSSLIPDPDATSEPAEDEEVAIRNITFWRDGFSVEDGPLLRYDDPENRNLLNEINTGHAPPAILNVRVGQPVELRVARRITEEYTPAPVRPLGPFEGQGNRLGSTAPAVAPRPSIPGAYPGESSTAPVAAQTQPSFEVDQSLPTTSIQVRLADGTRLVCRMNLTHTVGDIRNFINASRPGAADAAYTIQTIFPNRVLDDDAATIEKAGLVNSVVVQRMA